MKKRIMSHAAILAAVLSFSACQGDFNEKSVSITMVPGESYEVFTGDTVTPSGTANINVKHTLSDDVKLVTLISGQATLLRGDYKLNQ